MLTEGHADAHEPHAFVVATPGRNWCLRAPSASTKDEWVSALRANLGAPECATTVLEVVEPSLLADEHLLSLSALASADGLHESLQLRFDGSCWLELCSPLVRQAAAALQSAWQRLTACMGAPVRGRERADGWLMPRSEIECLPMLLHEAVVRPPAARPPPSPPAPASLPAEQRGWVLTKPVRQEALPWQRASLQRRLCVLQGCELHCHASEEEAAGGEQGGVQPRRSIPLQLVRRVRPCADPTAAPHAFELWLAGARGRDVCVVLEAEGGFEESDQSRRRALPLRESATRSASSFGD